MIELNFGGTMNTNYQPTRESVSSHPVPAWFDDAKLGIFVHWGLYSVPGWAPLAGELSQVLANGDWATWFANNPYAEWYMNSCRIAGSPTQRHHQATYGPTFSYFDFAPEFNAAAGAVGSGRVGRALPACPCAAMRC